MRKELAWLRRGPPARTSKPKFRIQAANDLIANEPRAARFTCAATLRDRATGQGRLRPAPVCASRSATSVILDKLDWSIGPGVRIGLVGVNGTGKTSVLRLLTGELEPTSGTVKRGKTLRIGYLSQALVEIDGNRPRARRRREAPSGSPNWPAASEVSADTLLEGLRLHRRQADHPDLASCRAASDAGSSSCACCSTSPTCCCSTSRPTTSTSTR